MHFFLCSTEEYNFQLDRCPCFRRSGTENSDIFFIIHPYALNCLSMGKRALVDGCTQKKLNNKVLYVHQIGTASITCLIKYKVVNIHMCFMILECNDLKALELSTHLQLFFFKFNKQESLAVCTTSIIICSL